MNHVRYANSHNIFFFETLRQGEVSQYGQHGHVRDAKGRSAGLPLTLNISPCTKKKKASVKISWVQSECASHNPLHISVSKGKFVQNDRAFSFAVISIIDNSINKFPLLLLNIKVQCVPNARAFFQCDRHITHGKFGARAPDWRISFNTPATTLRGQRP